MTYESLEVVELGQAESLVEFTDVGDAEINPPGPKLTESMFASYAEE